MKRGRSGNSRGADAPEQEHDGPTPGRRNLFSGPERAGPPEPGRRTLTSQLQVQRKASSGAATDVHERQADEAAAIVVAGGSVAHLADGGATSVGVAKKDEGAPHALAVNAAVAVSIAGGAATVIAEDEAVTLQPGQLRKKDFIAKLGPLLEAAARDVIGPLWSITGCPYIKHYLGIYALRSAAAAEDLIRRYTGSTATDPGQLMLDLVTAAKAGVAYWKETGKLPPALASADAAASKTAQAAATPGQPVPDAASHAGPPLQRKGAGDDHAPASSPKGILGKLGEGAPLDSSTAARMGAAFGTGFSDVRIHADSTGAELAGEHSAHAFTIGPHVAFAAGKYKPGTIEGDALLAHELTHVLQQRGAAEASTHKKSVASSGESASETDADRGAANAVSYLHGSGAKVGAEQVGTASGDVGPGLQLSRCIGSLNEGEQEALDAHGFWNSYPTFEGDKFEVRVRKTYDQKDQILDIGVHIKYVGTDDVDGSEFGQSMRATFGQKIDAKITPDAANDWKNLVVDAHGDGSVVGTVRRRTEQIDGWNPKSRKHSFAFKDGSKGFGTEYPIIVKSKNAMPGTMVNAPVTAGDGGVRALRIDVAATTTKTWLDEILTPDFGFDATKPPWPALKAKVDADVAKYTGPVEDARDEATRLTRLGEVITRARPMLKALGLAKKPESYLPDIAHDCIELISNVHNLYATGIAAAWDGPAIGPLNAADTAFNTVWYRVAALYMERGRGVDKLIQGQQEAAIDVKDLRSTAGRAGVVYRKLEKAVGIAPANDDVAQGKGGPVADASEQYWIIRDKFLRGETGALAGVSKLVNNVQVHTGCAALLSSIEIFRAMKNELSGIVGTVVNKAPGTTNYEKVCDRYISQFEKVAEGLEAALSKGTLDEVGPDAISKFQGICNDQFRKDCEDIRGRIKTVKTLEALGKVLVIVGVAALTAGGAAAAVGGALEGAGASAGVIATGEFAAEVVTFTLVNRAGNTALGMGNQASLGEDLVTNALMFGFLKAAAAGYGRVFKMIADPRKYKAAYAVGGAMTGMVGLQAFAEIHYRLKNHKWMDGEERAAGVFTNAVMLVALSLGGYLAKAQNQRIRQDMLVFAAKNVPGAMARIEGKIADLRGDLQGIDADKNPEKLAALVEKIEKLWNEQLSVLADAAKAEKGDPAAAAKAFDAQVKAMVTEVARLDLALSKAGVDAELAPSKSGNFFRPLSPNFVAFKAEGLEVVQDFYKENKGTFEPVKGKEGLYVGKDATGEVFFIADDKAASFFDKPVEKPPTESEAKANRATAERAVAQNKARAAKLRDLLSPHIQDGHVVHKFGRVINGTGLAAAMDANTLPGAAKGEAPPSLEALPDTIGCGTGADTFAKLGDTPIGQTAPELSGGGGWAEGASPADMTPNHGNYTSASNVAAATALTQLRSGVPILDASVLEVSVKPDGTWKISDAKVRIKLKLADGAEVFIYTDSTDIATGLGPPRTLDAGQINADPTKEAKFKSTMEGDGRLVYGDTVGAQKGGKVLVSGGSATGAWNAKMARQLGGLVDWIARDSADQAPPNSESGARKYQDIQDQLNEGKLNPAEAQKKLAELRAFAAASLPRNVQDADATMNDPGIVRHVKEIKSMTPTEEVAGEALGRVKVTFSDGTSEIYDQVVASHGTQLAAKGTTAGALSLTKGIPMKPRVVDGQVVSLESVDPPGAVRVVGAAMWSRAWMDPRSMPDAADRAIYEDALNNQATKAPRDSPANPLIFNVGKQIPLANEQLGGGPDVGAVKGGEVYHQATSIDPAKPTQKPTLVKLTAQNVQDAVGAAKDKTYAGSATARVKPGSASASGAIINLSVKSGKTTIAIEVTLEVKKAGDLTKASVHGRDAGPARLKMTSGPNGKWTAHVEVSENVRAEDLPVVIDHELTEAAEIAKRNPRGEPAGGFAGEMDASVMKPGAEPGAKPTAHDVAGTRELVDLYNDWKRLEKIKSAQAAQRKGVLDRAMEAQGLNDAKEVKPKQDLLRDAGAPKELLDRVGKGPWESPKGWNGPANHGEWTGDCGDSGWIDDRPEVINIVGTGPDGRANPIMFRQGEVDFTRYSQGDMTIDGLNGEHKHDMRIIRTAIAEKYGLPKDNPVKASASAKEKAALEWLRDHDDGYGGKGLRPHHAGKIQLIPKNVHKVQHTDITDYED